MLGLQSTVDLGLQASATNPATQARTTLNVYSFTGGASESMPEDNILGGGLNNGSDPVLPGPGLDDHRVNVVVPVCEAQFPLWMRAFFGAATAGGTSPNFTYDYASGAAALPYCYIEHKLQASDFRRHFGCVGESLDIDWSADAEGFARASLAFVGLSEDAPQTAALPGVVTAAPALVRNPQRSINITYNGVAQVIGGKTSFKRNLKRHRNADGTGVPYAVEYNGKSTLEGSLKVRYTGSTMNADAVARTARATVLELLTSATRGLRFTMATMRLGRTPVPIEGPDGVEFDFPFKGWQTSGNAALVVKALTSAATAPAP